MIGSDTYTILGQSEIHPTAQICLGVIIGKPYRKLLDGTQEGTAMTVISAGAYLGYYAVVGAGSMIGTGTIIDDYCIIESRVVVGQKSLITYRAQVCNDVTIANNCVIGGFIGERTRIGSNCRIFGNIVHLQHNPLLEWDADEAEEGAPKIQDRAFVGFNAVVAGSVVIGRKAYVCAGALVTKDVPEEHVVFAKNKMVHFSRWKGRLADSPFFNAHVESYE